jgi:hypothetical protein
MPPLTGLGRFRGGRLRTHGLRSGLKDVAANAA